MPPALQRRCQGASTSPADRRSIRDRHHSPSPIALEPPDRWNRPVISPLRLRTGPVVSRAFPTRALRRDPAPTQTARSRRRSTASMRRRSRACAQRLEVPSLPRNTASSEMNAAKPSKSRRAHRGGEAALASRTRFESPVATDPPHFPRADQAATPPAHTPIIVADSSLRSWYEFLLPTS